MQDHLAVRLHYHLDQESEAWAQFENRLKESVIQAIETVSNIKLLIGIYNRKLAFGQIKYTFIFLSTNILDCTKNRGDFSSVIFIIHVSYGNSIALIN